MACWLPLSNSRSEPLAPHFAHDVRDLLAVCIIPNRKPQPEEDVCPHHSPRQDFEVPIREVRTDLTLVPSRPETSGDTGSGRFIMFAIGSRFDELGLVDDPVDIAMIVGEAEEGFERPPFSVQAVLGAG